MMLKNKFMLLLGMVLALGACKDKVGEKQAGNITKAEVMVMEPKNIPLSFEFSARAQGSKETEVRARVGGILLKRNYVEGANVKEGSVLFQIDPAQYEVALSQAKAKLAQNQAQLKAAETQWQRISTLFEQRVVSEKSRDDARANLDALKASTALAQAEVDSAQLNLDYTTVTAPISGVTSMETHSEGSLIAVNDKLTSITQLDPIYVIFSASEGDVLSLSNMKDKGLIRNPENKSEIKAKVYLADGQLYPLDGEINFASSNIDEKTGTMKLRAVFPNPDKKLRPGQFLRLVLEGLTRINALQVPQEAVMQGAQGAYVYKVDEKGNVEVVNVKTGLTTKGGFWIVDDGLNVGDKVVVSGVMKLRPGMKVDAVIKN